MAEHEDPNPYEPPSGEPTPEGPATSPEVAQNPTDVPGRAWNIFNRVLSYANGINLVAAIIVAQLVVTLLQQAPNIMMGQTSASPFNPNAGGSPDVSPEMLPVAFGLMCVAALGGFILNLIISSLSRPIRDMHYRGPSAVSSIGEAISSGWQRILQILAASLLWGLMVVAGLVFCVLPGLVLAMISWIPVYMAATTELGVTDIIKRSLNVAQRQWKAIAVMILVTMAVGLAIFCPISLLQAIPTVGIILGAIGTSILTGIGWLWVPSVMLALEERDRELFNSTIWDDPSSDEPDVAQGSAAEW